MSLARIEEVVEVTNRAGADIIVLLGDFVATHRFVTSAVPPRDWAKSLAVLRAPLGVHAVLGNHDWWQDRAAQESGHGPVLARRVLEEAAIPVYENEAVRLEKNGRGLWLAGLGDQIAFLPGRLGPSFVGVDDLTGTLARIGDDAPVILMAHEPDIFPKVPERVALTLSGHTHGGQVRMFGYSPVVPSHYGNRYAYGHVAERREGDGTERHLVVSGGLGCSLIPVRFGVPPEVTLVELRAAPPHPPTS
jgi:hypothetical protein